MRPPQQYENDRLFGQLQGSTPLLISVPHSGTVIPAEIKERMQAEAERIAKPEVMAAEGLDVRYFATEADARQVFDRLGMRETLERAGASTARRDQTASR